MNTKEIKPAKKVHLTNFHIAGFGPVKMTVGVRRGNHEKLQYCITAIES